MERTVARDAVLRGSSGCREAWNDARDDRSAAEIVARQLRNRVHESGRVRRRSGKGEQRLDPDTLVRHDLRTSARNRSPRRPEGAGIELSTGLLGMTFVLGLPWKASRDVLRMRAF